MSQNSQYMRSVNDYSLSAHELFVNSSGVTFPPHTAVYVVKNMYQLDEFDKVKKEAVDYLSNLLDESTKNVTIAANSGFIYNKGVSQKDYRVSYRESIEENMDSYTIYGQDFSVLSTYNEWTGNATVVVESYRRSTELVIIILSTIDISSFNEKYEEIQNRYVVEEVDQKKTFHTIVRTNSGFDLQTMELDTEFDEDIIDSNYNDSFLETWHITKEAIDNNERGLILLHGIPGSGKTHVLKQIIARGGKRKIIYIPSYLATSLNDPSFVAFVRNKMTNSVLVIEDGEDVLMSRELTGGNAAVTNILNISDGIMGDALNILTIATFNCSLDKIDEALMRKGRMLAEYQFNELDIKKTNALVEKIHGAGCTLTLGKNEKRTLANIYKLQNIQPATKKEEKRSIGFVN